MKKINKEKFKNIISVVALALLFTIALSTLFSLAFSMDNHNDDIAANKNKLTSCDVWGHKWVVEAGKPATCQADGYTTLKYCSKCELVESEKVTLSKLNAHSPVYTSTGTVQCEFCSKDFGANYYYAKDFVSTTDSFVDDEYVTVNGTVVAKGCTATGSNYYLLVAGENYSQVVRVAYSSAEQLDAYSVGSTYSITGRVGSSYGAYTLRNVEAYRLISTASTVRPVQAKDYLAFNTVEQACRNDRASYFCKLIYVENPYLCLSSYTGTQANTVRFDNGSDVVNSNSEYFTFSLKYLREYTSFTSGSVVTFGNVTVKHRDKTPVQATNFGMYVYLVSWGESNMEFMILDAFSKN